jgi:hypothetical protein
MKSLIISILFAPSILLCQTTFSIENGKVVWQKVFNTTTPEDYKKQLFQSLNFENIDLSDGTIYVVIRNLEMDYKSLGKSEMTTSIYISRANYDAVGIIEFKDTRFRVTVKDLKGIQRYSDGLYEKGEMHPIEFWALNRKGEPRKHFLKNDVEIIDFTLDKLFYPTKKSKDDW